MLFMDIACMSIITNKGTVGNGFFFLSTYLSGTRFPFHRGADCVSTLTVQNRHALIPTRRVQEPLIMN